MGRVRWAWRFPAPIRAAASFSSPTPSSHTSTAPTPCSAESWPVWQCSRASPRATASAAFTANAAVGLERAAPPRGPPGGGAGPLRLLLAEERLPVGGAGGCARRHGVREAGLRPAVHREVQRLPPHDPPRAGARLPAEPRRRGVPALSAVPACRAAAVVERGAGRVLLRRGRQPRRDDPA